jgi:hypothetical protein
MRATPLFDTELPVQWKHPPPDRDASLTIDRGAIRQLLQIEEIDGRPFIWTVNIAAALDMEHSDFRQTYRQAAIDHSWGSLPLRMEPIEGGKGAVQFAEAHLLTLTQATLAISRCRGKKRNLVMEVVAEVFEEWYLGKLVPADLETEVRLQAAVDRVATELTGLRSDLDQVEKGVARATRNDRRREHRHYGAIAEAIGELKEMVARILNFREPRPQLALPRDEHQHRAELLQRQVDRLTRENAELRARCAGCDRRTVEFPA